MTKSTHRFQHGYALIIGVGRTSKHLEWSLPTTVRDAQRIRQVFTDPELCAYPLKHVSLLTNGSATKTRILGQLTKWLHSYVQEDSDSTTVIYFSGHGWRTSDGRYALIPSDIDPDDVESTVIWGDEVSKAINQLPCKRLLVILDCCYAAGVVALKGELGAPPKGFQSQSPVSSLVASLKQGEGRIIISSSRDDESSWIRKDGEFSIFTYHLAEALAGAATPKDAAEVRLTHIVDYLSRTVSYAVENDWNQWNASQTPWVEWNGENYPVALNNSRKKFVPTLSNFSDTRLLSSGPIEIKQTQLNYDISVIMKLLEVALTEEQLATLIFSHFRAVHNNHGAQSAHSRRLKLVEYAESQGRMKELVEHVKEINPLRFGEFEKLLHA